eukprot:8176145-Alexandrium_andersonii.AAC.1
MSASLVGSEMCIRDRATGRTGLRAGSKGEPPPPDAGEQEGLADGDGPSPVSYTHLTLPTICSV